MKIISDIRIYTSDTINVDGNPLPNDINDKKSNLAVKRIAMKLREGHFSLGDYDHLYINFTTCLVENGISLSHRSVDRYRPWFRYFDYHIEKGFLEEMIADESHKKLISSVLKVLLCFSCNDENDKQKIIDAGNSAVEGEKMRVIFKEKNNVNYSAIIFLRLFDDGKYHPTLQVKSCESVILEKELEPTVDLGTLGDIQLNNKKVTVKPRKSVLYSSLEPVSFNLVEI